MTAAKNQKERRKEEMKRDKLDSMIGKMNLNDKARQLTQGNAALLKEDTKSSITGGDESLGLREEDMFGLGSVLNFCGAEEALEIQENYLRKSGNRIPLIFMQDIIHGYRTIYPIPLAMGCTFDPELVEACAEMSAIEAKFSGVNVTFAPMVDLVRDARWGRVMESTGEDPFLNGEMGKAFIRGYHKGGIACCVKHFAGYGAAEAGKEYNTTDISDRNLREYYLRAYIECLKEKPEMVMTSFNLLNGIPVNGHKDLLIDLLRDQLNFDGVVISDYGAVKEMIAHGYLEDEKACAETAANNEIDIEMMSSAYIHHLPDLVAEGKVPEEKVDRMVKRVLALKDKLGLFENPVKDTDAEKAEETFLSPQNRELARQAAEKACVLLKNDGVLPLSEGTEIALVGPFAEEKHILGAWEGFGRKEDSVCVREGLERLLSRKIPSAKCCSARLNGAGEPDEESAVRCAENAGTIIACVGEMSDCTGESASRAELELPRAQMKLLKCLKKLHKPLVAVVFGGRPQVLTEMQELVDAILYVWQPGVEGGNAIANLLYGKTNPSGKLTMSFPRKTGQCPVYYNHFNTGRPKEKDVLEGCPFLSRYLDVINAPLYPFGYGLSYTNYRYSELRLSDTVMRPGSSIKASVIVENTGSCYGEEIVQLYIRDKIASLVRPVKELKGFRKVGLSPREIKEVTFEITEEMLKFYDEKNNFIVEEGAFSAMVGPDSERTLSSEFFYKK